MQRPRETPLAYAELDELTTALRKAREQLPSNINLRRSLMRMMAEKTIVPDRLDVEAVEIGGVPADRLTFSDHDHHGVLLYLHGGGYSLCSPFTHRALVARIGRACGLNALAPDYRLAPEHPFPAAVDDAVAAYRWLLDRGTPPETIVIAGDSAGGGLTLATMLAVRDAGGPLPRAAALISPWTDLAITGESIAARQQHDPMLFRSGLEEHAQMYLGDTDPKHPLASPLYADLSGLPPLLVHVGSDEILFDDAARVTERARKAGVDVTLREYKNMFHVWHYYGGMLPEADAAIDEIGDFFRERLADD